MSERTTEKWWSDFFSAIRLPMAAARIVATVVIVTPIVIRFAIDS
ncbi:MAG: hypothetical protein ACFFC6_06315 [Promethearchaeota archaeon]